MPAPRAQRAASGPAIAPEDTTTSDGSGEERRHVRLTDRKLVTLAARTARGVDWDALVARGHKRAAFSVAVQQASGRTSVTASGVVACSVAEMRNVLRPRTNEQYASTMRELYGQEFIYGAIVHRVDDASHARQQGGGALVVDATPSDVDVKTVTFARRHLLALSEQWCFVDALHALAVGGDDCSKDGFVVSMTSLHPDSVFLGKTKASVSALTDITVTYAVLPVDIASGESVDDLECSKSRVQVTFRAEFEADEHHNARPPRRLLLTRERMYQWRSVSERALVQRLKDMAASTQHLSRIIRRRRLSAQVFVDVKSLHPPNTRCVCCTKMLATILGRNKKQCHLCGFYVCEQCSRQHEIERGRVRHFIVRICEHCMERVDDGIYDNLPPDGVSPPAIIDNAPGDSETSTGVLGQLLQDALLKSSESRKAAVKTIIRTMSEIETPSTAASRLEATSSENEYLEALRRVSFQPSTCELANSTTRRYSLQYKPGTSRQITPAAPIPADEEQRLKFLGKTKLSDLKNSTELELICELAQKELGCHAGVLTVITGDEMHILASSDPAFQNLVVPREDAICAHTILSRELPILLPHPEADVRFTRQSVVRRLGLRFYFGFPLTAADGTAIGSFCCVDVVSQTVTKAQYAATERLARSASRIVQRHVGGQGERAGRSEPSASLGSQLEQADTV